MDTKTPGRKSAGFVPWRPTPGPNGIVTIGADYWDDDILRYKLGSPTPEHYLRLWNIGWLKFQGKYMGVKPYEKPEHYPTPEQVEEYLEWQAAEAKKKEQVARMMAKIAEKQRRQRLAVRAEPTPSTPVPPVQTQVVSPASKAPKPKPEPPQRYTFPNRAVDPVVFQQYRLAATALKTREETVTREALAEVLFLPRESVDAFLDSRPEFEAELKICPEAKKNTPEVQKSVGDSDISISAIKMRGNRRKPHYGPGLSREQKEDAFNQASAQLWVQQKPTPLKTIDLVRRARELLGKDKIAEGSLNTQLYDLFSESQRMIWLDPRKGKTTK